MLSIPLEWNTGTAPMRRSFISPAEDIVLFNCHSAELPSPDPLLSAQLIYLLHGGQGLEALLLHHGVQALVLLRQLRRDPFLLVDLVVTCGLTLSRQDQLRESHTHAE